MKTVIITLCLCAAGCTPTAPSDAGHRAIKPVPAIHHDLTLEPSISLDGR